MVTMSISFFSLILLVGTIPCTESTLVQQETAQSIRESIKVGRCRASCADQSLTSASSVSCSNDLDCNSCWQVCGLIFAQDFSKLICKYDTACTAGCQQACRFWQEDNPTDLPVSETTIDLNTYSVRDFVVVEWQRIDSGSGNDSVVYSLRRFGPEKTWTVVTQTFDEFLILPRQTLDQNNHYQLVAVSSAKILSFTDMSNSHEAENVTNIKGTTVSKRLKMEILLQLLIPTLAAMLTTVAFIKLSTKQKRDDQTTQTAVPNQDSINDLDSSESPAISPKKDTDACKDCDEESAAFNWKSSKDRDADSIGSSSQLPRNTDQCNRQSGYSEFDEKSVSPERSEVCSPSPSCYSSTGPLTSMVSPSEPSNTQPLISRVNGSTKNQWLPPLHYEMPMGPVDGRPHFLFAGNQWTQPSLSKLTEMVNRQPTSSPFSGLKGYKATQTVQVPKADSSVTAQNVMGDWIEYGRNRLLNEPTSDNDHPSQTSVTSSDGGPYCEWGYYDETNQCLWSDWEDDC